jgi:hypothetical protein
MEKSIAPLEIIFEPKRAFFGTMAPEIFFETLLSAANKMEVGVRLALATVIRTWDEPILTRWLSVAYTLRIRKF